MYDVYSDLQRFPACGEGRLWNLLGPDSRLRSTSKRVCLSFSESSPEPRRRRSGYQNPEKALTMSAHLRVGESGESSFSICVTMMYQVRDDFGRLLSISGCSPDSESDEFGDGV